MYTPGLLKITNPPCETCDEELYCDGAYTEGHIHKVYDNRGRQERRSRTAYLPHSCDLWVIGGAEQVRQLIADLQAVLPALDEPRD